MTLDYIELRKQFKEIERKLRREDQIRRALENRENKEYEARVKSACKSNWNGIYINLK